VDDHGPVAHGLDKSGGVGVNVHTLLRRWHWKNALLSALIRAVLFYATNISASSGAARRAALIEFLLRVPMVGTLAAVGQAMSLIEPVWKSVLVATVTLPLVANAGEFVMHSVAGTPRLWLSVLASMGLSAVGTLFNQFAMRRGVLVVGAHGRRFVDDLKQLPTVCAAFVCVPFVWTRSAVMRRLETP
jgi:hypothetical protein